MSSTYSSRDLLKKRLVSLVYLAISLVLVGQAAAATWTYVDWFRTLHAFELEVDRVMISDSEAGPEATIVATLQNPSDFGGVRLQSVVYYLFLNSTTENFFLNRTLGGAPVQTEGEAGEFGFAPMPLNRAAVPARDSLNLTIQVPAHWDIVALLRSFLDRHSDLRFFVSMTFTFQSSYGYLRQAYCEALPEREFTICPNLRPVPRPPPVPG